MTGYSHERAQPHEARLADIAALLSARGYQPEEQPVDRDRPDLLIHDFNRRTAAWVDVKTSKPNQIRRAVKLGALETYWRLSLTDVPVYIVWEDGCVDTVHTMSARIVGGPRRQTGNGSRTDWVLIERGGTPFNEFFPAREDVAA